jgi:hypothetical protein
MPVLPSLGHALCLKALASVPNRTRGAESDWDRIGKTCGRRASCGPVTVYNSNDLIQDTGVAVLVTQCMPLLLTGPSTT